MGWSEKLGMSLSATVLLLIVAAGLNLSVMSHYQSILIRRDYGRPDPPIRSFLFKWEKVWLPSLILLVWAIIWAVA